MELDPQVVASGANAAKSAIDALRALLGIYTDATKSLPAKDQQTATLAIEKSIEQLDIAEAQIARALGYELCKCQFPPTVMLTVGHSNARGNKPGPIYECPKCGYDTAAPFSFIRTAPPRE
ncbi:hypothetical protein [Candidatus Phyllobacterium onerii]|uniref:hypothetical protein n=1 Tax=Candidatus Phyllobacterium onerii TaxID=3020828 RepID=UPI00232C4FAA|nr:hypothetical protein [Phyllobacterium sp. IY22]